MANPIHFFDYPCLNQTTNESERAMLNLSEIQCIKTHANVSVDPGAVDTQCVEVFYKFGTSDIILIDYDSLKQGLDAYYGIVDENGIMT